MERAAPHRWQLRQKLECRCPGSGLAHLEDPGTSVWPYNTLNIGSRKHVQMQKSATATSQKYERQ